MLGPYGQLLNGSPHAVRQGLFAHNAMGAFQWGINHGSVQVMRDQVGRRGDAARKALRGPASEAVPLGLRHGTRCRVTS